MVIATLTGKAATLICGRTLASFLVRPEHAIIEKNKWLKLDKLLRRYMQIGNVRFGGIHIVLVGDFFADATRKIRSDLPRSTKPSTVDVGGFERWRTITTVVIPTNLCASATIQGVKRAVGMLPWGAGRQNSLPGSIRASYIARTGATTCSRFNNQLGPQRCSSHRGTK
ncbi:hypothetical protein PHMEG_00013377 [Phytophthora megakarya]|uniref:Uncharacterized protein n=1 Tax=Phytophthora megakarya TaxID=4795 RepID=A0A225W833_9STRA|nr:hypothetical protein PHMEG_00013377 [Phytophthora megakarya]